MIDLSITEKAVKINCCKCYTPFLVIDSAYRRWSEQGEGFYCPYCGTSQHFTVSKVDALKKEISSMKRQLKSTKDSRDYWLSRHDEVERRRVAQKAATTRLKNRVKNGVCPCCNRSFQNLAKHMSVKHPNYSPDNSSG